MAKKKKKRKQSHTLNIQKAQREAKKRFMAKAEELVDTIVGERIFYTLPLDLREVFYYSRYHILEVFFPPDMPAKFRRGLNRMLKFMLSRQTLILKPSEIEIDMITFLTVWQTIDYFFDILPEGESPKTDIICQKLKPYINSEENDREAMVNIEFAMFYVSLRIGRVDNILEFKYLQDRKDGNHFGPVKQYAYPKFHRAEWRKFLINGELHSAFQFGGVVATKGFQWFKVNLEHFDKNASMGKLPINVFIQKHAIRRLKERIDTLHEMQQIINTFESFDFPKVIKHNGKFFFEYRVYEQKAGYFVGQLLDGTFVIQTFLFLTNNGTPEGEKLNKTLGVKKLDKKFLEIDKLSTFQTMDDKEAEELEAFFKGSGIEEMFDLRRKVLFYHKNDEDYEKKEYMGKIKNYLTFEGEKGYDINEDDGK